MLPRCPERPDTPHPFRAGQAAAAAAPSDSDAAELSSLRLRMTRCMDPQPIAAATRQDGAHVSMPA